MYQVKLRRVPFTPDADSTLKMMRGRTGLLPNIICRVALCLSLDEAGVPKLVKNEEKSQREINRFTLLGEYDAAFTALVKARLHKDGVAPEEADDYFVAHIHRGISLLPSRVRSIADIAALF